MSFAFAMISLAQVAPGAFPLTNLTGVIPGPGGGCDLLVGSLDVTTAMLATGGAATVTLDLGDLAVTPALQGLQFYMQVADFDFSAGWIGTYTTNGLACTVGVL